MTCLNVAILTKGTALYPTKDQSSVRPFFQATLYNAVLGQLIGSDANGSLFPLLLSSYSPTDKNFKKWRLTLNSSLKFHNGRLVSITDFEFSILRHLISSHETAEVTLWKKLLGVNPSMRGLPYSEGMLPSITIIDKQTLQLEFSESVPNLPEWLVMSELSLVPKEALEEDFFSWRQYPVGAGPYKIHSSRQATGPIKLERWINHYKFSNHPPNRYAIYTQIDSSIDIVIGADKNPDEAVFIEAVLDIPFAIKGIFFNYKNSLAQDKKFRKQIASIVDRTQFTKNIEYRTQTTNIVLSGKSGHISPSPILKELIIGETGVIQLPFRETFFSAKDLDLAKNQLQESGLKIERTEVEGNVFSDSNTPFELLGLIPDCNDPLVTFGVFQVGGFWIPILNQKDPKYEMLYQHAVQEHILNFRSEAFKDAMENLSKHFIDECYAVPLFEEKVRYFLKIKKIKTINPRLQRQTFMFHEVETLE